MHVITRLRLTEFWQKHPNAQSSLQAWYKLVSSARWKNLVEVKKVFPSADLVGNFVVFNISGNNYRLIALIDFKFQKVFVRHVLTHADYDKDNWKKDGWFE